MNFDIKGKSVVIIGATGGLGSAIAKAFAHKGAKLLLAGRREDKLREIADSIGRAVTTITFDLKSSESILALATFAGAWSQGVDIVVNATGHDVRKTLENHNLEDIENTIETNLKGTILLTQAFSRVMKDERGSTILHIGGFADGRMAFPYYSVDVATRAGVYSFVEAMNRELEVEGKLARLSYFCPSPADTEAERPYHELWQSMGIQIASAEKVAEDLIKHLERQRATGIMGGLSTLVFAKLNSVIPKLADILLMKKYSAMLKNYFYPNEQFRVHDTQKSGTVVKIAVGLVVVSTILFGLIFLVPFMPLSLAVKAMLVPVLVVLTELFWWVGILLVGKAAVNRYKKYLNPCNWFN